MRLLVALSLVQTACIVYLLVTSAASTTAAAPAATAAAMPADAYTVTSVAPALDEQRLRGIIREELAAYAGPAGSMAARPPAPVRSAEADARQREQVEAQIAHYRSVGKISDSEMQALQGQIAGLDPATRKEMLARLVRAINAHEIDGQM